MIIEKTFHVNESVESTKTRLSNIGSFRRQLDGMKKAYVTADGVGHFEFDAAPGFIAYVDLAEVESDDANQTLFRSYNGNLEVAGLVEYHQIREDLTEVVLTLDYTITSPLFSIVDRLTGCMDRFLNRQLLSIQSYFQGAARTTAANRRESYVPLETQFEQTPRFA